MNFRVWVDQVRMFSKGIQKLPGDAFCKIKIDPPLPKSQLTRIKSNWPGALPEPLKELWTLGSARVHCPYSWTPPEKELPLLGKIFEGQTDIYGGVRFLPAQHIFPGNSDIDPEDEVMLESLGRRNFNLWCRCAVFLEVGNGDCLGLDPDRNPHDPAVVYLVHDQPASGYISPSFTRFLRDWTELSFIGPEWWLLDHWLNRRRGTLDPTKHKTEALRKLLSPRPEPKSPAPKSKPKK